MNTHISSGAIVYKVEDGIKNILLLHRSKTDSWHLSKGTQNLGESLEETALREIKEETGLDVKLESYIGKLDSKYIRDGVEIHKETNYFIAQVFGGDVAMHDHEHDKIVFVDYPTALSRLENFSLYEEEGKILKMAESHFV